MSSRIRSTRARGGIPRPHVRSSLRGLAAALAAAALAGTACGTAAAATMGTVQPQTVPGPVIHGGADGTPRTVMCPAEENAMGGGFTVSAPDGRQLDGDPSDVLQSRPTADATGWIVSVRKNLAADNGRPGHDPVFPGGPRRPAHLAQHEGADPADLTVYVVCTQGENTPGG